MLSRLGGSGLHRCPNVISGWANSSISLVRLASNREVSKDDIVALEHAKKLPFDIKLSPLARKFVKHLDAFGRFRYLEISFFIHGPKFVELDRTVWEIRRYCKVINYVLRVEDGRTKNMLQSELAHIASSETKSPQKFRLKGGFLEKILDKNDHPARSALVWQNAFFGSYTRKKLRVPTHFQATNAPLTLRPEILDEVIRYVYLPSKVAVAYREEIAKRSSG